MSLSSANSTFTQATQDAQFNKVVVGRSGQFTANGATAVPVAVASITAKSVVLLSLASVGASTAPGTAKITSLTAGTGFSSTSSVGDVAVYNYVVFETA